MPMMTTSIKSSWTAMNKAVITSKYARSNFPGKEEAQSPKYVHPEYLFITVVLVVGDFQSLRVRAMMS